MEQAVEHVHHLRQLGEARHELEAELERNRGILDSNIAIADKLGAALDQNMMTLRVAQISRAPVAQPLNYRGMFFWPDDGPWQINRQSGTLSLMSHAELAKYTYIHEGIAALMLAMADFGAQANHANAIARRGSGDSLTAKDIEELITATSTAQGTLGYIGLLLQLEKKGINRD